jgi:uncharacterized protein YndB with AHSA1/START domain
MTETTAAVIAESQMEVEISGSAEAVWNALTEDIGAWWPADFYAGGRKGERSYHLEARLGGRMYESWADGGGVLWGTVVTLAPHKQLQVTGSTFPAWGGPSVWFATWDLEETGEATTVRFSENTLGRFSEEQAAGNRKAWRYLFGVALKAHVEGTPVPAWEG